MSKLRTFLRLPLRHKLLLGQACWLLGWYRLQLARQPLARLTLSMQHDARAQPAADLTPNQQQQARDIGYLVAAAAVVTPWDSRCLLQTLVTQRLLAARAIPGQILLGVSLDAPPQAATDPFAAHAWLSCGGEVVSGDSGHQAYTVISSYRWT